MDFYVPKESFSSQYPDWGRWHWLNFKALRTPPERKVDGPLLFTEGQVNELRPLPDRPGFKARVTDGKTYRTTVWLTEDPVAPDFKCGCGIRDEAPCVHVMALLAALVYLFHEHNFIPLSPLLDNVNRLAADIDRSSRTRQKPLRRLRLRNLVPGPPYLEGDAAIPEPLVKTLHPHRPLSRMARNTLELPQSDRRECFRTLVDYVRDCDLAFEAENPEGGILKLASEAASVGVHYRFISDPDRSVVRIEEVPAGAAAKELLADLGGGVQVLRQGRVALLDEDKFKPLPAALFRMERGFRSFDRDADEFDLETFNDFVARLDHRSRRLLRQCAFAQARSGEIVEENPKAAETLALEVSLDLERTDDGFETQMATLGGQIDHEFVALGGLFSDFMFRLCDHAEDADRLLGRRKRVDAILDAAAELPRIKTQAKRRAFIDSVVRRHEFRTEAQSKATAKFLREIERDYCRAKSATVPMIHQIAKTGDHAWRNVRLPLPGLLAVVATLYRHSPFQQIIGMSYDPLPVRLGRQALFDLAALCESFGIHFEIEGKSTRVRPVDLHVDCATGAQDDWFELKPSVRCDRMEIPSEQWAQLLDGSLRLTTEDGSLVAPRPDRPEALAKLVEALGGDHAPKSTAKIKRIHLLDWILWRNQGIDLRLPPEIEALFHSLLDFDGIPELPLPSGLRAELRPYQRRGFEWLVFLHRHRFGACLADDMGLGKTLQSLAFLAHLKSQSDRPLRALAVLPPSLLYNWESEAARFTPDLRIATYAGSARDPGVLGTADLVLTTYDLLRRDSATLERHHFPVVIFDEAQALKNHNSRRARAARRLDRRFTLCLTGTPLENHVGEFHSIMDIALPGLMGERKHFDQALKDGDDTPLRRARPFLLRRTKETILKELPPKVESDVYLEMDDAQREIYTRIVGELREEVLTAYQKQSRAQAGITALAALTRLRQLCVSPALLGHELRHPAPKIQYLVETLAELRDEGQSVLVFSQFVKSLDRIEAALRADGSAPLRLDGSTPQTKRKEAVHAFQTAEGPQIFLISLKAGGVGLNLTRAGHVLHVDPWWNPSVENQASDRAHRIGQHRTVFVQRLIMRDSVEEKIMALKARKKKLFDSIVDGQAAGTKGAPAITKEDFQFLLGQ
ncbi:MAG: SNF2-related protein [Verrucomicrobiota bacterium]